MHFRLTVVCMNQSAAADDCMKLSCITKEREREKESIHTYIHTQLLNDGHFVSNFTDQLFQLMNNPCQTRRKLSKKFSKEIWSNPSTFLNH